MTLSLKNSCAALLSSTMIQLAHAEVIVVTQKNKQFSVESLTLKAGDKVVFKNDDDSPHNVFSSSEGMRFNLDIQDPGTSNEQTFNVPVEGQIRCAIHPRMKIAVKVAK